MANPPQTGKAAILKQPKTKLVIEDRQLAPLKDDEILIRIKSTAINPVDWKMRDYDIFIKEYPTILGSDGAGTVVAVGSDVTGFTSGDRVFFQGIIGQLDSSTFQEYCKMPAKLAAKTPANISDEEAAGICVASVAVITAFYDTTGHGMTPPWASGGDQAGRGKAVIVIEGLALLANMRFSLQSCLAFENNHQC